MNSETNKKQEQLLLSARTLFWKYGFRRVTIQDICKEASISKMTFYRFFSNKTEIAKAVFDREVSAGIVRFRSLMKEKSSPSEKIQKMILMKQQGVHEISREFLLDFYSSPELGLKSHIEQKTAEAWQSMLGEFRSAQKKGYFRKDFKPEFYFLLVRKVTELLNDPQVTALYPRPEDLVVEMTKMFAYGISAPGDKK